MMKQSPTTAVIAGLDPAIPNQVAHCLGYRDARDSPRMTAKSEEYFHG